MCISFEATNLRNTKGNIQITNSKFQIKSKSQISNHKSQITSKRKIPNSKSFFGIWNLINVIYLLFTF